MPAQQSDPHTNHTTFFVTTGTSLRETSRCWIDPNNSDQLVSFRDVSSDELRAQKKWAVLQAYDANRDAAIMPMATASP